MPIKSKRAKKAILVELKKTRAKGDDAELELIMQGKDAEAKKVRQATNRLARRIDDLLAATMRDWLGHAATLQDDLRRRNARLQRSVRNIQNKLEIVENVVKVTGMLDEAAKLAAVAARAIS